MTLSVSLLLLGLLTTPARGLLLGGAGCGVPRIYTRASAPCMQAAPPEEVTVTLTGCGSGIGIGLDSSNCVDLLKPGSPAANSELQIGDHVVQWNGNSLFDELPDGSREQRKLKDVVVPAESHTLVVERARALDLADIEWESGLTCVEFADEGSGELRLGVYIGYSVLQAEPHIRPLCASSAEDGVSALLCDEEVPPAALTSVRRVLDPDVTFVSERQAGGGQGLGNPHGEHGEECYDLRDTRLSAAVRVVVREGRDSERVL